MMAGLLLAAFLAASDTEPPAPGPFPVAAPFTPLPEGPGWTDPDAVPTRDEIRRTLESMVAHGITHLYAPIALRGKAKLTPELRRHLQDYAEQLGMGYVVNLHGLELFPRNRPPEVSVYAPEYPERVREHAEDRLRTLDQYPGAEFVICYQDEPFHQTTDSFGHSDATRAEFERRYGYPLPDGLDCIRNDPATWLDVINFRSSFFPDGWRQTYDIIKDIRDDFTVVMTHDSHNSMGSGVGSDAQIAVDDVFHWGGAFVDMFIYDIYPYMTIDYRYGLPSKHPKPRMSQFHYSFAQMRNLATAYGKGLGFWYGAYTSAWFERFMGPELRAQHWTERITSTTAVAQGSDLLICAFGLPEDAGHYADMGDALRLIQAAGPGLVGAPRVKANAAFLFPRTQHILLQEEYWNVGLSFELFTRAFGELDTLHEDQVIDADMQGYPLLVLCDVTVLSQARAERIAEFVRQGGVVIADCVPYMTELKQPLDTMKELFGVTAPVTGRVERAGTWLPMTVDPVWVFDRPPGSNPAPILGRVAGEAFGDAYDFPIASPRPCEVVETGVLLRTHAGQPALMHRQVGKGHVFLLGFCLQDTYFQAWHDGHDAARAQLRRLLEAATATAGVHPRVQSSNPDIEAAVRARDGAGFLFLIRHDEATDMATTVALRDLPFVPARAVDVATGKATALRPDDGGAVTLRRDLADARTAIYRLVP